MVPAHYSFDIFRGARVHLGVCGSVAAYKALELTRALTQLDIRVTVTLTHGATQFLTPMAFLGLGAEQAHISHAQEPFLHLEPGACAGVLAVAPATANILAKMAYGLADDLLSTQILAYPGPILVAPAMNPRMWQAAATQANVATLQARGVLCVGPDPGPVACGETGTGRLAPIAEIFVEILRLLTPQDLQGRRVLITAGPTREYFDPARFWSNPSTGTMGAALAVAASLRGATVEVVHGPMEAPLPRRVQSVAVTSAQQMYDATLERFPAADLIICAAAVADFRPPRQDSKYKKDGGPLHLTMERNPDILATLGQRKAPHQRILGFAAETGDLEAAARTKLARKGADMIAANPIGAPDAGFASTTNRMIVLDRHGRMESWPTLPKTEVAWRLLQWLATV